MLTNEAAWLEDELARLPTGQLDPLLSIGSGTTHAREVVQPWITTRVYEPLERRGVRAIHHEYAQGPGVDVTGDLADPGVADELHALGARSVLCCNVLEHVADRTSVAALLESLVAPDGVLVVTVPRRFPFHPDPIDTMYRPSVTELSSEFAGLRLERGAEVECGTLLSYLRQSGSVGRSLINGVRAAIMSSRSGSGPKPGETRVASGRPGGRGALGYFFRTTSVTCAVLRRPAG